MKVEFSFPRGQFPRLCLVGNSNVGKSSITKLLLSHPHLYKGKVGKTPGSTTRLNLINDTNLNYQVIDLPGFGYMRRVDRQSRETVQDQILQYIEADARCIFLMLLIISADRLTEELDKWYFKNSTTIPLSIELLQYILNQGISCVMVLNKIDKLNRFQIENMREKIRQVLAAFHIEVTSFTHEQGLLGIIETSVTQKIGLSELKQVVVMHANRINLKSFDKREELLKKPPVVTSPKRKKSE